jgi:hypothetical protein
MTMHNISGASCVKLVTTRFVVKWQLTLKYAFLIGQFSHLTLVNLNNVFIQPAPAISSLPRKFESEINSSDCNFRLGERQLLHLTRVITIAHRLSTILDRDRMMILDQERVVECGTPEGNSSFLFNSA